VLVEISRVYDGMNNGRLGMSVRMLADRCHIARGTVRVALEELQDRGFIECVTKGTFSRKVQHASEWRLTAWPCHVTGNTATKAFMSWRPEKQNPGSKYPATGSNQDHTVPQNAP
jgi:DNA-binding transcriptional MocR family regulator